MILWKSFDKYDPSRPFGAWARGVAARKIMEDRRLRARLPESVSPEVIEELAHAFEPEQGREVWLDRERALVQCIQQLPQRSGALIADRYSKGRSMDQISQETGLSAEALYQALSRLRKQLRDCVARRLGQSSNLF